jgi:predicted adenylyl cyclase CyaB
MTHMTEVEVRGLLNPEQEIQLRTLLNNEGKFIEKKERVLIDYSLFLPDGGIRNRTKDIRIRTTNGRPEIITKIGAWGDNEMRREISIPTGPGTFDSLVEVFGLIGLTRGALCIRNSEVYEYMGVEFSIVEVPNHSKYFEAEKLVAPGGSAEVAHTEIKDLCVSLNLEPFDKEGFMRYLEILNTEANPVFDYSDYQPGDFQRKYNVDR